MSMQGGKVQLQETQGKKKKQKSSLSSSKADFQNEQSIDKIAF